MSSKILPSAIIIAFISGTFALFLTLSTEPGSMINSVATWYAAIAYVLVVILALRINPD